jgi:phenylacetate-coenzyme A ligase PaaK-like adenylate-forming protein
MFDTGVRQLRVALATVLGLPIPIRAVQLLVNDALATLDEFGAPGDDVNQLLDGPYADPALRTSLQTRALRRTARRLANRSGFYRERFAAAGVDPARLTLDGMRTVPVTTRQELVDRQDDLLCGTPYLSSRTTGTTGSPAEVWLSRPEVELWPAMVALAAVLRGDLGPTDHVMVCVSSRATAAIQVEVELCRLVGAACSVIGIVPPELALARLCPPKGRPPTVLNTYPSYLGALVTAARDRGLGPGDFALHTINVGSELLSAALVRAARETFGVRRVNEAYGATELMPAGGRVCSQRHLHMDPNLGYTEVLHPATGDPAAPGELGTLVVTPYYPYRECLPVFRYDTRDLVRMPGHRDATQAAPSCEIAAIPAVSQILGKARDLRFTRAGPVTPRDLVEVLEAVPGLRWPVRYSAEVHADRLWVTVAGDGLDAGELADRLAAAGIDADVRIEQLDPDAARALRPLRCDLVEQPFHRPVLAGSPV